MIRILPPFGLSDHNVVFVHPKTRTPEDKGSRKVMMTRDIRDWSVFDLGSCEVKANLLENLVNLCLDTIMPIKRSKVSCR